jgi:hypothetical protein
MNLRQFLTAPALATVGILASCDRDSKVFSEADLAAERSTVAGRVTGIGDTGISGVVVTAQAVDTKGAVLKDVPASTSLSGLQGRFSMDLRPGLLWKISWQSPMYRTPDNGETVDLGLRQVVDLSSKPKRLTYRYGWVMGRTTPGASVIVDGQDASTTADGTGFFKLDLVIPGAIDVIAMVPGKGYGRERVNLAAEETDTVLLTTIRPLSSVSGVLTNQDGSPQANAKVVAMGGLVRDTTDAQGRFTLPNLPARGRVQVLVDRGLGSQDRLLLPTPGEDSVWDVGTLPLTGSVAGPGVRLSSGVVVADSGETVNIPLLWEQIDPTRTVIGFAWDTTGKGQPSNAVRTWGPRLAGVKVGNTSRAISAWVTVAEPLSDGSFDTSWSSEARINLVIRQKEKPLDSLDAPTFSHAAGPHVAPLRIGLGSDDSLALLRWSTDSVTWTEWDGDSIVLYDTTTLWTHARRRGFADSRIARRTFLVRPSAVAETLKTPIAGTVKLPKGSLFKAYTCPTFNTDAQLVLDTGAVLEIPSGCGISVENGATLELRAGSRMVMGAGTHIDVGYNSVGTLKVSGAPGKRAGIVSKDAANPMGSSDAVISLNSNAGGSRIDGLDLDGARNVGILVKDTEVDILRSRIRNCGGAGIEFQNKGRPALQDGVSQDSISRCRWSVQTTPYALGRIATNPGFADTLLVLQDIAVPAEDNRWKAQPVPVRVEPAIFVQGGASLTLDAGLDLAMGPSAYFWVGYDSPGSLITRGTVSSPVTMRPANPNLGWGYARGATDGYGIALKGLSSGSVLEGLHLVGSGSNGILVDGAEVTIRKSVFDSCANAAIQFIGTGHPKAHPDDSGLIGVVTRGNRWSLDLTPTALAHVASNPGFTDTIRLAGTPLPTGNNTWNRQKAPFLVWSPIEIGNDAHLTIAGGSRFLFKPTTYVYVGGDGLGSLVVQGTATAPVEFLPHAAIGWGFQPNLVSGYCMKFESGTVVAELRNLVLEGAPSNGIVFGDVQSGVGVLDSVTVKQLGTFVSGSFGLVVPSSTQTGAPGPKVTNYTGTPTTF